MCKIIWVHNGSQGATSRMQVRDEMIFVVCRAEFLNTWTLSILGLGLGQRTDHRQRYFGGDQPLVRYLGLLYIYLVPWQYFGVLPVFVVCSDSEMAVAHDFDGKVTTEHL